MRKSRITILAVTAALAMGVPSALAAQADPDPLEAVPFSARFQPGPAKRSADTTSEVLPSGVRVSSYRGSCWTPTIVEVTDARLDGDLVWCSDEDRYVLDDQTVAIKTGTLRIQNDAGAWVGERLITEWTDPSTSEAMSVGDVAVLVGEGAYDGYHAIMTFLPDWSDIRGVVVAGSPPPAPIPPVSD